MNKPPYTSLKYRETPSLRQAARDLLDALDSDYTPILERLRLRSALREQDERAVAFFKGELHLPNGNLPDWLETRPEEQKEMFGARTQDWRNYIPEKVAAAWDKLSPDARAALYLMAQSRVEADEAEAYAARRAAEEGY